MKLLLTLIMFLLISQPILAEDIIIDHPEKSVVEQLLDIKDLMVQLEDKLNDDRVDIAVQLVGIDIEKALIKLIKDAEDSEKNKSNSDSDDKNNSNSQKNNTKEKSQKGSKDSNGSASKIGEVIHRDRLPWE